LLGIINDVLDFSRIEAGKLQVHPAAFDLQRAIDEVLSLLSVTASDKGLQLKTDVALPTPCWVHGDAARIRQVLHNLIGNAIKFTETGEVCVRVRRDGGEMEFRVADTGMGIPPQHLPLVFDAFHQVDGTFGRRHRGTGLGLTISREAARAMGGEISCTRVADQGSVFTLRVPLPALADTGDVPTASPGNAAGQSDAAHALAMAHAAAHARAAEVGAMAAQTHASLPQHDGATPAPGTSAGHILLAEDNAVNALVAEATLSSLGVTVTRVENGMQALAELQREDRPYDVALMACQRPALDGSEATRRLRMWEHAHQRKPVPVVALTANAMASDRERCMSAGMNEHLAKPFKQADL